MHICDVIPCCSFAFTSFRKSHGLQNNQQVSSVPITRLVLLQPPCILGIVFFDQKLMPAWAWRDNLVVKNTYHSFRGPRLGSQCPHGSSQVSVTPVLGNLMPLLTLPLRTPMCLWYTPIHPDTYKHKIKQVYLKTNI